MVFAVASLLVSSSLSSENAGAERRKTTSITLLKVHIKKYAFSTIEESISTLNLFRNRVPHYARRRLINKLTLKYPY